MGMLILTYQTNKNYMGVIQMTTTSTAKKSDNVAKTTDKKITIINGGNKQSEKQNDTLLTPNDLGKQFGCDSKKIRVILRKHKIQKNDDGKYGWTKPEYDKIAKIIKIEMETEKQ